MHAVMAYVGPLGKPYMHFHGGPDVWDPISRHLALLWDSHNRGKCRSCGTHRDDWDPERGGALDAYVADDDLCPGDQVLAAHKRDRFPNGVPSDVTVFLRRNPLSPRWTDLT